VEAIGPNEVHGVLGRVLLVDGFDFVYDLDRSSGRYLYDAKTGKKYLDFFFPFLRAGRFPTTTRS
jgi:L-lysine 6-transaminase